MPTISEYALSAEATQLRSDHPLRRYIYPLKALRSSSPKLTHPAMDQASFDPDIFTKQMQLTRNYHRDLYPAIEPGRNAADKIVLITGASRGLGRGLAISWARAGASGIAICSRVASSLETVSREIESISPATQVLAMACDTTDSPSVERFFQAIRRRFG